MKKLEALESGMCDIIKLRLKTRSWKGNQPLNIKTAEERPILKLGLPNFRWRFYFISLLLHASFLDVYFKTSHMPLSSAWKIGFKTYMTGLWKKKTCSNLFLLFSILGCKLIFPIKLLTVYSNLR